MYGCNLPHLLSILHTEKLHKITVTDHSVYTNYNNYTQACSTLCCVLAKISIFALFL